MYLKPYVQSHLREYVAGSEPGDYLFPGREGPISPNAMRTRFKIYVREAGLPDEVSPHTLRHSAAVHYLMGGAPISFVQNLLGHESLETTGIYTQLVDEVAKEITLSTEHALSGRSGEPGVRESADPSAVSFAGWDDFVASVLPWLAER